MATVAAITELEAELSQAREAAQAWIEQCAEMINTRDFRIYDEPQPHLLARAREASAKFHAPLARVLSLVQQSQMLGTTDEDAIRLAVRRIDAALRLRRHDEWGPEIL